LEGPRVAAAATEEHLPQILTVQTTNVTITSTKFPAEHEATIELGKAAAAVAVEAVHESIVVVATADEDADDDEEDKENVEEVAPPQQSQQHVNHPITNSPSQTTKLMLEKSSSISYFPDAPTTPKVCRKMLYEDEADLSTQVKEIVKKYQVTEQQQQQFPTCCNDDAKVGECLVCHPKIITNKPPSLELDKGITC